MGGQAFTGRRRQEFYVDPDDLIIIGLDTNDGPEHLLYDERIKLPVDPGMVANVARRGVREAVFAIKDGERAVVTDGRQRVRWARAVNAERKARRGDGNRVEVPVLVTRGDATDLVTESLSLNACRIDDSILVKARKCKHAMDVGGASIADLMNAFGVTSEQTIRNWLGLLDLDGAAQKAVAAGELPMTEALKLKTLPRAEQKEAVAAAKTARENRAPRKPSGGNGATAEKPAPSRATRPARALVLRVAESLRSDQARLALRWALGEVSTDEAAAHLTGWPTKDGDA